MSQRLEIERVRLNALTELAILDTPGEVCYDDIVEIAALVCGVPISLVTMVDSKRQWFKANIGLDNVTETPREVAFCAHAIEQDGIFEINDASQDPRFSGNPLVTGSPNIRFYAGSTLRLNNGAHVGTLCVIDDKPKCLSDKQRKILSLLSANVVRMLEARQITAKYAESEARFRALSTSAPVGIFSATNDGECTYSNERWQEIFGMNYADALGFGWADTLHPEDKNAVFAEWQRTAASGIEFDMNFRIQRAAGSIASVRAVSRPVMTADGAVTGHVGSVEDITERSERQEALRKSEVLLAETGAMASVGGWELDLPTKALKWTDQTFRIHDLEPGKQPSLETALSFYTNDSRPVIESAVSQALKDGSEWDLELPLVTSTGRRVWVRSVGRVETAFTKPIRLIGAVQDITEHVLQRQILQVTSDELAQQHELLSVTFQSIADAVITTDIEGYVTWLNPVAEHLTGWSTLQAIGKRLSTVFNIVYEDTRKPAPDPIATCLVNQNNVILKRNIVLISSSGAEFGVEESAAAIRGKNGELRGVVLVFHDVTEQRKMSNQMKHRAMHDMLTGLVNRSEFENQLRLALTLTAQNQVDHALLYVDLDQFKLVNDSCGHAEGDLLLVRIAKMISNIVQHGDTVARIGGDEFAVILRDCAIDQAVRIAQAICNTMREFRFLHGERRFRIGTSIGVVCLDDRWDNIEAAMQAADVSCYTAKEEGRNRVHVWYETDVAARKHREGTKWAARIEQALDEDRFELHAQKIHSIGTDERSTCAEVLIRMRDKDGKLVYPNSFIAAAERFCLATRIDHWVLRKAITSLRQLSDGNDVKTLFINLSGQSVGDREFHSKAIELLTNAGIDICQRLCLEITETAAVTNMEDASTFIDHVRALGVRVALDDFGAGASSFGYLKTLKVDVLKIDGQFIDSVVSDPLSSAAVRCFVEVAEIMGIKTVAEYVSNVQILKYLADIGVDYAQGFHLHRPEPLEQFLNDCSHHAAHAEAS